jgi:hypothetical protein
MNSAYTGAKVRGQKLAIATTGASGRGQKLAITTTIKRLYKAESATFLIFPYDAL